MHPDNIIVNHFAKDCGYKTPCWIWNGSKVSNWYGRASNSLTGKRGNAHRIVYEILVGPIQEGLVLDHLCRNPPCVNPDHMEPVTNQENTIRGMAAIANRARMLSKPDCKHGHILSGSNLSQDGVRRRCKTCARISRKKYKVKKRSERNG